MSRQAKGAIGFGLLNAIEHLVVHAHQRQEPRLAEMTGHRRPVEALHRIAVFTSEHGIGDEILVARRLDTREQLLAMQCLELARAD